MRLQLAEVVIHHDPSLLPAVATFAGLVLIHGRFVAGLVGRAG
jgi:hypothetical protein